MAWSDKAREAAVEARRRKRKLPKIPHNVGRSFYASELRQARTQARAEGMQPGKKRNKAIRRQAKFMVSPKLNYGD